MGNTQGSKQRGGEHYLHKQWIATRAGKEEHAMKVKADREKKVIPLTRKGGRKLREDKF